MLPRLHCPADKLHPVWLREQCLLSPGALGERERGGTRKRREAAVRQANSEAKSRLQLSLQVSKCHNQKLFSRKLQKRRWAFEFAHCTLWLFITDEASSGSIRDLVATCSPDSANQRSHAQQLSLSPLFKENLISCRWISKLYINSSPPFFHLYS